MSRVRPRYGRMDPSSPSMEATFARTTALRSAVETKFLPLFDHLITLARSSVAHGYSQRAGIELRKARKLAGDVSRSRAESKNPWPIQVTRVRLDRGGYDTGGRYWGIGAPLWQLYDRGADKSLFVRAATARDARTLGLHNPSHWGGWR